MPRGFFFLNLPILAESQVGCTVHHEGEIPGKKFGIWVTSYRNSLRFNVTASLLSGLLSLDMRVYSTNL